MAYQIPTALSSRKPYVVLEDLGEGAFGKVVKIKRNCDGKVSASSTSPRTSLTSLSFFPDPRHEAN